MPDSGGERRFLLFRTNAGAAAIPLACVREILRPLPVAPLAGMPHFLRGLAVIRGSPTPVVDLGRLLGLGSAPSSRFVLLALNERTVAIAVDAVLEVRALPEGALTDLPSLLAAAEGDGISAVGALDGELLLVLEASRLLPQSMWTAVAAAGVET